MELKQSDISISQILTYIIINYKRFLPKGTNYIFFLVLTK